MLATKLEREPLNGRSWWRGLKTGDEEPLQQVRDGGRLGQDLVELQPAARLEIEHESG